MVKKVHRLNVDDNRYSRHEVKELLIGRGLSERKKMLMNRERAIWDGVVYGFE